MYKGKGAKGKGGKGASWKGGKAYGANANGAPEKPAPGGGAGVGKASKGLGPKASPQKPTARAIPDADKNQQILDNLLPFVSSKIDENGGVMKTSDICQFPEVKDQLSQIPNGFPKVLPKILSQWTDFFVVMPNGLIGTAQGYDTGMILPDGTLNPDYASTFSSNGKSILRPKAQTPTPVIPGEKVDLTQATNELSNACLYLEDDQACAAAFRQVQVARAQARGEAGLLVDHVNDDSEKTQKRQQILTIIFEILNAVPDKTVMLNTITQDARIRELKKGQVPKFLSWLQGFPANFVITPNEGTSEFRITLLSDTMPRLPNGYKKPRQW